MLSVFWKVRCIGGEVIEVGTVIRKGKALRLEQHVVKRQVGDVLQKRAQVDAQPAERGRLS